MYTQLNTTSFLICFFFVFFFGWMIRCDTTIYLIRFDRVDSECFFFSLKVDSWKIKISGTGKLEGKVLKGLVCRNCTQMFRVVFFVTSYSNYFLLFYIHLYHEHCSTFSRLFGLFSKTKITSSWQSTAFFKKSCLVGAVLGGDEFGKPCEVF